MGLHMDFQVFHTLKLPYGLYIYGFPTIFTSHMNFGAFFALQNMVSFQVVISTIFNVGNAYQAEN